MLLEKYQNLLSKDIEKVISHIFDNYNVTENETKTKVDKETIVSYFLSKQEVEIQRCCGILNSGLQCSRSAMNKSMYCKMHHLKNQKTNVQNSDKSKDNIVFIQDSEEVITDTMKESNLKKIFIDDTLFFCDNSFLYDFLSKEKVGYKNENGNYILTSDPFILDSF